jgi:hypothetical protein
MADALSAQAEQRLGIADQLGECPLWVRQRPSLPGDMRAAFDTLLPYSDDAIGGLIPARCNKCR